MNKEQIHDEQINPLVDKLIAICEEHGIAMLCTFHIPNGEDENLYCTTALPDETNKMPPQIKAAVAIIQGQFPIIAISVSQSN